MCIRDRPPACASTRRLCNSREEVNAACCCPTAEPAREKARAGSRGPARVVCASPVLAKAASDQAFTKA
eukprot:2238671-Alexandrium_andersonii.AAC.1